MPAKAYLDGLSLQDRVGLSAYFQHLADTGEINNQPKKFKHEEGLIWAFKRKGLNGRRIRIACYRDGKRWILTHGFDKPAQKLWPPVQLDLANEIRLEQQAREQRKAEQQRNNKRRETR
jgi:hypothetical protein